MGVLQCFVLRCDKCGMEAHVKAEGPPYFDYWQIVGDHDDSADGWKVPNTSPGNEAADPEVLCCKCYVEGQ